MKRGLILLFCLTCSTVQVQAQPVGTGTISGFVYDASNGEALIGANVYLEGTVIGSSTNQSGYYVIPRVPVGTYFLLVHYIGYSQFKHEVTVTIGTPVSLDARLEVENIELEGVVVTGDAAPTIEKMFEAPVSKLELSGEQIRRVPQVAEADLLRALQTLPGVLPLSDFSSALYVRGGTPDQNLNLIDGSDVYNAEHAFGLFSTFNTDAIKQVDLSKGGFPAEYGGRLSSVLDVTNIDGNREEFEGTTSISLLSFKTTLQMPLGQFGSISGSIRRTYFDKTIGKAIDDVPNYYFYDGNVKAFLDLSPRNKLTLSFYGGEDVLNLIFDQDAPEQVGFDYDWGNTTGSARWTHIFSPQLFANLWVTGSRFESSFDFQDAASFVEDNFVSDITFKGNFEYHYSKNLITKFGFEQKNLHTIFKTKFPGGNVNVDARPKYWAGYVSSSWRPTIRWDIEAGLRYNLFDTATNYTQWAPRMSLKYRLSDAINVKAAGGVYSQFLHRIPRAFIADIWSSSNQFQRGATAYHGIFGIQKDFGIFQLEIEGYHKQYENIYAFNQTFITELAPNDFIDGEPLYTTTEAIFNQGDGKTSGFEVLLKKDTGALTGWLGYSYANTEYKFSRVNQGFRFPPRHDRRHTFNLVGNLDYKNFRRALRGESPIRHRSNWIFAFTLVYSTGQPLTIPGSGYFTNAVPNQDDPAGVWYRYYELYPADINNFRIPHYARLDLSLTWEKHFRGWSIAPYIQAYNIGNRRNVWFVDYEIINGIQKVDTQSMMPIIPTIGIRFDY